MAKRRCALSRTEAARGTRHGCVQSLADDGHQPSGRSCCVCVKVTSSPVQTPHLSTRRGRQVCADPSHLHARCWAPFPSSATSLHGHEARAAPTDLRHHLGTGRTPLKPCPKARSGCRGNLGVPGGPRWRGLHVHRVTAL